MSKKILIYGAAEQAEVCHYYFERDSDSRVVAFVVDEDYFDKDTFLRLPVLPWREALKVYPPRKYNCFVAIGYKKFNQARKEIYGKVKRAGYTCPTYISSRAVVLNDSKIGDNCLILENNTIQPFVTIGSNTTIWSGNHIGHHSTIGDHVFISSHVVISGGVEVGDQCFIGVNATLRDHITIGKNSVIGAGALIMHNVEENSVYVAKYTEPKEHLKNQIKLL